MLISNLISLFGKSFLRIEEKYPWQGLTKDVKKLETCPRKKIYRLNLNTPFVITETKRRPFEGTNIDILEIPFRQYILTVGRDGLDNSYRPMPSSMNPSNLSPLYFGIYNILAYPSFSP